MSIIGTTSEFGDGAFIVVAVMLLVVVFMMGNVAFMVRSYKKVPPGKVMVIHKIQRTQVTRTGSVVFPIVWSHSFVHAEAEEVEYETPEGPQTILVALGDTEEDVLNAHTKFGEKSVEEIKVILKRLLENSSDRDADLAKVGYKIVC